MLNRPLVELIGEIPDSDGYNVWWIALVSAAFGTIVALDQPTVLWRRHARNTSPMGGLAQAAGNALGSAKAARRRLSDLFNQSRPRMAAFLERYRDRLKPDDVAAAEAFVELPRMGPVARRAAILYHRLWFTSPIRNTGLMLFI